MPHQKPNNTKKTNKNGRSPPLNPRKTASKSINLDLGIVPKKSRGKKPKIQKPWPKAHLKNSPAIGVAPSTSEGPLLRPRGEGRKKQGSVFSL